MVSHNLVVSRTGGQHGERERNADLLRVDKHPLGLHPGITQVELHRTQCPPKVSSLVGLKQVQTQLLSFYVTLIHKNPKELNPKIGGLLRYRLHRVVKSL